MTSRRVTLSGGGRGRPPSRHYRAMDSLGFDGGIACGERAPLAWSTNVNRVNCTGCLRAISAGRQQQIGEAL